MTPMDEGLGHLLHLSDQLKAHLRDLQSTPPEEFAQLMQEHATPEEQALVILLLEKGQAEIHRIISEIERMWEAKGLDVEDLRKRRKDK